MVPKMEGGLYQLRNSAGQGLKSIYYTVHKELVLGT